MQTPRPTTHTFSPQQEAILTSLSRGANRISACHAAGLPRRIFYNWIKTDPAFSEAVEEAEAESIGVAEDLAYACAMKAIEDPRYLRALFFWLKHRAGWIQARPDRPPSAHSVGATGPVALDPSTHLPHVVGARHAVPSPPAPTSQSSPPNPVGAISPDALPSEPAALPHPKSPSEDDTPTENPAPGVPSVPSKPSSNPKSAIQNPKFIVPFVPSENTEPETSAATHEVNTQHESPRPSNVSSRRQDQMRMQQFRRKRR